MAMAFASLRREDKTGLVVAVLLHLALLAALIFQPEQPAPPIPERMTVNLAEDVGLDASSPDPVLESRASTSPEITDTITPEPPMPEVVERTVEPRPAPSAKPQPRQEQRRPAPRESAKPKPKADSGGSRQFDQAFAGAGSSTNTDETRIPASQIGASAKASLVQAIGRQLKPHWQPPNGPDVDQIVTMLRFRLNPDGSLASKPEVVRQTGINDTNRAQAARHAEQAVRAVQLAAPFDLPEEFYNAWKLVGPFGFDWKLAQ